MADHGHLTYVDKIALSSGQPAPKGNFHWPKPRRTFIQPLLLSIEELAKSSERTAVFRGTDTTVCDWLTAGGGGGALGPDPERATQKIHCARALWSSLSSRRATHSRDRIRVYRFLLEDELMRYLQQCVSRCFSPSSPEPPPPFLDDPPLLVGGAINAVACELERMAFIAIVGLAH